MSPKSVSQLEMRGNLLAYSEEQRSKEEKANRDLTCVP